jgi:hypothetical protein
LSAEIQTKKEERKKDLAYVEIEKKHRKKNSFIKEEM